MIETIFETTSPLGEPVALYKNIWKVEEENAETLSIVTGLHGDRLTGLYTAMRLTAFLDQVVQGDGEGFKLTGTVQLFPVMHARALEAGAATWNFDNLDTDVAFPGSIEGELTEKLCNTLLQHTVRSDYGLLIKGADRWRRDASHIRLLESTNALRNLASLLGMGVARLAPEDPSQKLQLTKHWNDCGIKPLTLCAGGAPVLDRQVGDALFEGVVNFLLGTGLLCHPDKSAKKTELSLYAPKGETVLWSKSAGLLLTQVNVGEWVSAGQTIGEVRDIYDGKTLEEIVALDAGMLVSVRDHPLISSGEPVAWVLTKKQTRWFWPIG